MRPDRHRLRHCARLALAAGVLAAPAHAAIVINAPGGLYAQNFDSLTTSTADQAWTNDSTLAGWSLVTQSAGGTPAVQYKGGSGTDNEGFFYSFGSAGSGERALGGVGSGGAYFGSPASGAVAGWIAVAFTNGTGAALDGFSLGFTGEQWRNGGNAAAQSMVLEYGFGATFATVSGWMAPGGAFDWSSPIATVTAGALDGNAAANRVANRGGTINTPWSANETLWLRWIERNDVGNDHGLAIDDFSFAAGDAEVPLPAAAWLLLSGLGGVGLIARRRRPR